MSDDQWTAELARELDARGIEGVRPNSGSANPQTWQDFSNVAQEGLDGFLQKHLPKINRRGRREVIAAVVQRVIGQLRDDPPGADVKVADLIARVVRGVLKSQVLCGFSGLSPLEQQWVLDRMTKNLRSWRGLRTTDAIDVPHDAASEALRTQKSWLVESVLLRDSVLESRQQLAENLVRLGMGPARNDMVDLVRKASAQKRGEGIASLSFDETENVPSGSVSSPEDEAGTREELHRLWEHLGALSPPRLRAFEMYGEGSTVAEIVEELGVIASTVHSWIHRTRAMLSKNSAGSEPRSVPPPSAAPPSSPLSMMRMRPGLRRAEANDPHEENGRKRKRNG